MEKLGLPQWLSLKNALKIDFEVTLDNEFFDVRLKLSHICHLALKHSLNIYINYYKFKYFINFYIKT